MLNRFTSWKEATLKSLARNTIIHQSIRTTASKAKAARPTVEKLIRLAKENTLFAKRQAYKILNDHALISHLFNEIGPRFKDRASGFTRIINLGNRRGDDASVVIFELTEIKQKVKVKKAKKETQKETPEEQAVEKPAAEEKPRTDTAVKEEKHPEKGKPQKKFFGGFKNIFKKERDSL
jgi:large subunit ribosomal protein L17